MKLSSVIHSSMLLVVALLYCYPASAQATHQVNLTWSLSTDDTTTGCASPNTCTQNVYRASGACSTSTTFGAALANIAGTATSFTDLAVQPGQTFCYAVTFVLNGTESGIFFTASVNTATAKVIPFPPTSLVPTPK